MKKNRFKDKNSFISDKISQLIKEGYERDQAIATAYSEYERDKYPDGGEISNPPSNLKNIYNISRGAYNQKFGEGFKILYRDPTDPNFIPERDTEFVKDENYPMVMNTEAYKDYLKRMSDKAPFTPTQLSSEYDTPKYAFQKPIREVKENVSTSGTRQGLPEGVYTKVYYKDGTFDYIDNSGYDKLKKMPNYRNYMQGKSFQNGGYMQPKDLSFNTSIDNYSLETPDEKEQRRLDDLYKMGVLSKDGLGNNNTPNTDNNYNYNYSQPIQFSNPYSGVDTETASQGLGSSIANNDTFGTITNSAKILTSMGRNVMSGLGNQTRLNADKEKYFQNQRDLMTGRDYFFQEGGDMGGNQDITQYIMTALQQEIAPEQIVQKLVELGIPENEAVQTLQTIIAQMQGQPQGAPQEQNVPQQSFQHGGEFLETLKGKRILGFNYDKQTDSYKIDYE